MTTDVPARPSLAPTVPGGTGPLTSAPPGAAFDLLILDGGTRQSLSMVRSLGRHGLRVAVSECFAECDPGLPVLSFLSRHAMEAVVTRSFATCPEGFAEDVVAFVRQHPTAVVVPGTDGSVAALRPRRADLAELGCTLALAHDDALEVANDKNHTLEVADLLGVRGPDSMRVDSLEDLPAAAAQIGFPLVLKPVRSWSGTGLVRLGAVECLDLAEAIATTNRFLSHGMPALAQEWVSGARQGVTLFVAGGAVRGAFAHEELRTTPAIGGASVVRRSIAMPPDLYEASVHLVTYLGLEGLSGVEFRRDSAGRPRLMEINARPSGTMEIALRCGIDFPRMLWEWSMGMEVHRSLAYVPGVRMRWLRGDTRWLWENHQRAGRPDSASRSRAAAMFLAEFVRTPRLDGVDLHDPAPIWSELRAIAASLRAHQSSSKHGRGHHA